MWQWLPNQFFWTLDLYIYSSRKTESFFKHIVWGNLKILEIEHFETSEKAGPEQSWRSVEWILGIPANVINIYQKGWTIFSHLWNSENSKNEKWNLAALTLWNSTSKLCNCETFEFLMNGIPPPRNIPIPTHAWSYDHMSLESHDHIIVQDFAEYGLHVWHTMRSLIWITSHELL